MISGHCTKRLHVSAVYPKYRKLYSKTTLLYKNRMESAKRFKKATLNTSRIFLLSELRLENTEDSLRKY